MGILGFRKKGEQEMTFVESRTYSHDNKEKDLHTLIKNNPQLIAPEQEDGKRLPTAIIGSEMSLPSGRLDLLLMDIEGRLTLVELKRGRAAREVIAQTLNYAADLHYTTLEELEELVRGNTGYNSLSDVVAKLQEENSEFEEVDIDEIRKQISDCLNGKDLQLLIVSYEVDEETKKIARFLRNTYGIKIWCVEFDYFQSDEFEFFVPETVGLEDVKQIESKQLTPKQRAYKEFFGEILSRIRKKKPGIRQKPPPSKSYCQLPIEYAGIHFEWAFHKRPDTLYVKNVVGQPQ